MRGLRSGQGARAAAGLLAGLSLAGGCVPEEPPVWQILDPRLLMVEVEVRAAGPLSTPLSEDPPGLVRQEGLPGDLVRLRPVMVGLDGPIVPTDPPIWVRMGAVLPPVSADGTLPLCTESEGFEALVRPCRLGGHLLVLPPVIPGLQGGVWVVASWEDGPGSEECLARVLRGRTDTFGCHSGGFYLPYGPPLQLAQLQGSKEQIDRVDPDLRLSSVWMELEIDGEQGTRSVIAYEGDTVVLRAKERAVARVAAPEEEMQVWTVGSALGDESLDANWWLAGASVSRSSFQRSGAGAARLAAPEDSEGYFLYVVVTERWVRWGQAVREAGRGRFLWVRVVRGEPEASDL